MPERNDQRTGREPTAPQHPDIRDHRVLEPKPVKQSRPEETESAESGKELDEDEGVRVVGKVGELEFAGGGVGGVDCADSEDFPGL